MIYTGKLFEHAPNEIADISVSQGTNYLWVEIAVNGNLVIKFPLSLDADSHKIIFALRNIVNQTGLVSNPVEVELTPVEP